VLTRAGRRRSSGTITHVARDDLGDIEWRGKLRFA
jgi:hypothetical protein